MGTETLLVHLKVSGSFVRPTYRKSKESEPSDTFYP